MKTEKILITGFQGFIGKNLLNELSKRSGCILFLEENIFLKDDWQEYAVNFLNENSPTFVFHVGDFSDTSEIDVDYIMTRNYEMTKILSDWCYDTKVPLIFSSSNRIDSFPRNLYAWSKKVAEDYIIKNEQISLRYFSVYGPGEENKGKAASIAYQAYEKYSAKEVFKLFPGRPKNDFIYVKDVISANIHAYENYENLGKKVYHVGTGEAHSFEEVLEALNIPIEHHHECMVPQSFQAFVKASESMWLTGWQPEYSFSKGMNIYYEYLKIIFSKSNL